MVEMVFEEPEWQSNCPSCKRPLMNIGTRIADPWPEEEGPLYRVELYVCANRDCMGPKKITECWPPGSG